MQPPPFTYPTLSRRGFLQLSTAALLGLSEGFSHAAPPTLLSRKIPKTQEALPAIGLGTWQTFDIEADTKALQQRLQVLRLLQQHGGTVIDSSPMYGRAEAVVGQLCQKLGGNKRFFFATKVWTHGKDEGIAQMKASLQKMRTQKLDLMQIHNLVDWKTHLRTLKDWKARGIIRYIGITHYLSSAFDQLESIMRHEDIDFVQIPYSIVLRDAEKKLLPLAAERKIAVLINRPYEGGDLFARVRRKPVPLWIKRDLGCTSWAQVFLKFILSHPQVTCVIPGTSKPKHLLDNLRAGHGPLPTTKQREQLASLF
ncbi:MAG: aldo/keto reductase [Myxococcales bacterium]|nr:aldo/keto reductase [Myxococcales bacterium]